MGERWWWWVWGSDPGVLPGVGDLIDLLISIFFFKRVT